MTSYRDDDGDFVFAGDQISFSFGIPPVQVVADLVVKDGDLVALTPKHTPKECKITSPRRHVGPFYKVAAKKTYITDEMLRSGV